MHTRQRAFISSLALVALGSAWACGSDDALSISLPDAGGDGMATGDGNAFDGSASGQQSPGRRALASAAAAASAVELELAATAVFLHFEGAGDSWAETARRKPEKAQGGRLERARALLDDLRRIETPVRLPDFH